MSRSVSTPPNTLWVSFFQINEEEDIYDLFENIVADWREAFPSLSLEANKWLSREDRVLAGNRHAYFGISTYGTLAAIWCVPRSDNRLGLFWSASNSGRLADIVGQYAKPLRWIGRASNGEAFFQVEDKASVAYQA